MLPTWTTYIFLGIVVLLSSLITWGLPINELFKGIAVTPAIASLFFALFRVFRDEAEFQKKQFLQEKQQFFNLASTSHMANVAFDKHVEFCELYLYEGS